MPKFHIICENDPSQNFTVESDTIENAGVEALEELGFWVSRDYSENLEEKELTRTD